MGDHLSGLRQLIGTLGVLVVLLAPVWTAGTVPHEKAGTFTRDAAWILQVSGPEAKGIRSPLSGLELSQASYKNRSLSIWVVMAGLGLALPLLVPRSHLTPLTRRPSHSCLWPPTLPRAPPLFQFS